MKLTFIQSGDEAISRFYRLVDRLEHWLLAFSSEVFLCPFGNTPLLAAWQRKEASCNSGKLR